MNYRAINESCYDEEIEEYDVIFLDPPFKAWNDVSDKILSRVDLSRQTVVCISNFQNVWPIYKAMGTPRIEIVWFFDNGKWVCHDMPQLCHENIWIYGRTHHAYLGPPNKNVPVFKKSSIGKWSSGERILTKPRTMAQLKTVIVRSRISEDCIGKWIKPVEVVRPLVELCCRDGDRVLDAFAGAGGISSVLSEYDLVIDAYEIDGECFDFLKRTNQRDCLFNAEFPKEVLK